MMTFFGVRKDYGEDYKRAWEMYYLLATYETLNREMLETEWKFEGI